MSDNGLVGYKAKLADLREHLIRALGVETVTVLIDRSLEEVITVYPGLAAIEHDEDEMKLDNLDEVYKSSRRWRCGPRSAPSMLVMLLMLARMLGKEIALRLAGTVDARRRSEGDELAPR